MASDDDAAVRAAADQLEREAREMERRSGELQGEIDSVRNDVRRKRNDPSIPGLPPEDGDGHDPAGTDPDGVEAA